MRRKFVIIALLFIGSVVMSSLKVGINPLYMVVMNSLYPAIYEQVFDAKTEQMLAFEGFAEYETYGVVMRYLNSTFSLTTKEGSITSSGFFILPYMKFFTSGEKKGFWWGVGIGIARSYVMESLEVSGTSAKLEVDGMFFPIETIFGYDMSFGALFMNFRGVLGLSLGNININVDSDDPYIKSSLEDDAEILEQIFGKLPIFDIALYVGYEF